MKRLFILLAAVAISASCIINVNFNKVVGNGTVVEKAFTFDSFDAVQVAGAMDVVYIQEDATPSAVLRTDENLIEEYTLEVQEGVLVVSHKKGSMPIPTKGTRITVTAPDLRSMKLAGSGDCSIPNGLQTAKDFTFSVSGSGDLDAYSIRCGNFTSSVSGSGDISVGTLICNDAEMSVSGSGDIEIKALTAENVSIAISGSGSGDICCREAGDINVRISGSGSISLSGTARSLSQRVSGSGGVHARGLSLSE